MEELNISNFTKIFRKYNRKFTSDEKCLNSLFNLITEPLSNEDEKYANYYLCKSDVSNIMNRKSNVPLFIKEGINKIDFNTISDGFTDLLSDIDKSQISLLKKEMMKLYKNYNLIEKSLIECNANDDSKFLTNLFYICLNNENKNILIKPVWSKGKNKLIIQSGNILSLGFDKRNKNKSQIIVIPVDTKFTMNVDNLTEKNNMLISPNTLHGKWIKKIGEKTAKEKVNNYLLNKNFKKEIGAIIPIAKGNTLFYLLAISKLDINNNAHATKDDINKSVISLLDYYDKNGQGYPLYIPLIGTGMSRVGFSYRESIETIKNICLKNCNKINGIIYIVPYSNELDKMEK